MKVLENKVPPPLVAIIFGVLIWWLAQITPKLEANLLLNTMLVSLFLTLGAIFAVSGILAFRKEKTTANPLQPHKASSLVNTGIYRITRNPMYVGLAFVLGGLGVFLHSPASLIGVTGYVLYIHYWQILPEERALLKLFGEEYKEYQSNVRRWL